MHHQPVDVQAMPRGGSLGSTGSRRVMGAVVMTDVRPVDLPRVRDLTVEHVQRTGSFTDVPVPDQHGSFELTGMVGWMATLKSAWLLMTQPLARLEEVEYDRAARRRTQREGKIRPRVRVIHLRRPAGVQHGPNGREYHHQWVVRGHWRQQWYSSREVHRPVWIAPHVKGPEDAPLLGGEKVYAWSR